MPRRFEQRWRSGLCGWWASWGESLLIAAGTIHIFLAGNTQIYQNNFFYKALKRKILSTHIIFFQVFFALSGKTGEILWGFENHIIKSDLMSVFVAQFIDDLDGDGVQEVLAVHGGDELSDPGMGQKKY